MTTPSTPSKPVIILVPGAWHTPHHYAHLSLHLNSSGYTVSCLTQPSSDPSLQNSSYQTDVSAIREAILSHIDAGRDVVLVMHSYGAVPGSEAAFGLGKKSGDGQEGGNGVVKLIYLAAWMVPEKWNFGMKPEGCPPVATVDENNPNQLIAINPKQNFYHDVPEQIYQRAVDNLVPMSLACFKESSPEKVAWHEIPSAYILCEEDYALPPWVAEQLLGVVKDQGVDVEVVKMKASHSPFLSMPRETAKVIRRLVGESI